MATAVAPSPGHSLSGTSFTYPPGGGEQGDQNAEEAEEPGEIAAGGQEQINYKDEFERLKSYPIRWEYEILKRELVKCGFYYLSPSGEINSTGRDCKLKCAFCNKVNLATLQTRLQDLRHEINPECDILSGNSRNNITLGDNTNFRFEKNRLITFLVSNWVAPVDPYDLAKWGFYFTGVEDVTRCNFCRLEVRGWEPGDDGESEHRRWNESCPFLRGNRMVGNVELGRENEEENNTPQCYPNEISNNGYSIIERIKFPGSKPPDLNARELNELNINVINTSPPRHPDYKFLESRLKSFETWPTAIKQRPQQLAEAGFYYTGTGDRVVCFQCGGGLKDWEEADDPWVEHASWFPNCNFVLLTKGKNFVRDLDTSVEENRDVSPQPSISETSENNSNSLEVAVKPIEAPSIDVAHIDSRLCNNCNEKELGVVFLPCGHMVSCPDCAAKITAASLCPACKSKINAYVRAYLP